jgi:hypothetical protein
VKTAQTEIAAPLVVRGRRFPNAGWALLVRLFGATAFIPFIAIAFSCLSAGPLWGAAAVSAEKSGGGQDLFGWVEWVIVGEREMKLKAKLDTGAETSSLDATGIRILRRRQSGERFVEFQLTNDSSGRTITFKKRQVREARIKQHDGSFQTRPVVVIAVCLGDHLQEVEFTLIDRSHFLYPVLLGRSALVDLAVVDPSLTFSRDPACSDVKGGS